jgi:two-component system, NtrC family, sensor histidine kinase PilS
LPRPSSSDAGAQALPAEGELRVKLTWLTVFRTVAISLLMIVVAARLLSSQRATELSSADSLFFLVIGAVYGLTLAYGFALRRRTASRLVAWVQLLGDVVLASCLAWLTGGSDSPFLFAYSLAVVAGAILLFRKGALVVATASSVAFVALVAAIEWGWLPPPLGYVHLTAARALFAISSHVLSQYLLAVLAGYLSEQVLSTGGRLSAREADIRQLVDLQNRIVSAMPSGLVTCEADGRVTFINPAAAAILGHSREQAVGRPIEEILPGVLALRPNTRRAELQIEAPSGKKTLGLMVTPLEADSRAQLVVFSDLTEVRRMQDELKRIDHLASLGRMSAQLAHEIRNPLASMRGSAQMLAEDVPSGAPAARLAQVLLRESDRLAVLVEEYLKLARPPPPQARLQRLDAVVAETVEMLRIDPVATGVKIEESLMPVQGYADVAQLKQVLINLLRNALVAAGRGGQVRVKVADEPGRVRIDVWDSAGSIPPDDLHRIFDPFYTTREGGTGLGLSTVYAIVKAHGGAIEVSSSPETGTTFSVGLPDRPPAEA